MGFGVDAAGEAGDDGDAGGGELAGERAGDLGAVAGECCDVEATRAEAADLVNRIGGRFEAAESLDSGSPRWPAGTSSAS